MYAFVTIIIIITCVLLTLIVLVQNPKGSGLGASFGGGGGQAMGVQRTSDFLEKGTWTLAISLLALSLLSNFFVPRNTNTEGPNTAIEQQIEDAPMPVAPTAPIPQPPK